MADPEHLPAAASITALFQAASGAPSATRELLTVFGSVNADTYIHIDRIPSKGETVLSLGGGEVRPGGKGANQAVGIARLTGHSELVAVFGNDANGVFLRRCITKENVNLNFEEAKVPSGQAFILLHADKENSIIVVGGSNNAWPAELSAKQIETIRASKLVLLQREIPPYFNELIARTASAAGVPVILDVGGSHAALDKTICPFVYVLAPNKPELELISGMKVETDEQVVEAARHLQLAFGCRNVLAHLGERGSIMVTEQGDVIRQFALRQDNLVDTTGAGDAFSAGFAVCLSSGGSFKEAMHYGSAVAAVKISRIGAMEGLPTKEEVEQFLKTAVPLIPEEM